MLSFPWVIVSNIVNIDRACDVLEAAYTDYENRLFKNLGEFLQVGY